jgi:hypothetical protein
MLYDAFLNILNRIMDKYSLGGAGKSKNEFFLGPFSKYSVSRITDPIRMNPQGEIFL